jgi:NCS1 family nucleobase:cation symporter-1
MSVNVAANVVSPSYDFSNAAPRLVSFRTGGIITGVIGIAIQPWRLLTDPHVYIFTWLGFYGGVLGTVAGVLIAGYWVRSRTRLDLGALYTGPGQLPPGGTTGVSPRTPRGYWFTAGWNWRAVIATVAGALLSVGGAYTAPGTAGPFPGGGLIPAFKTLYDYSWVVGLGVGFTLYLLLSLIGRDKGATA